MKIEQFGIHRLPKKTVLFECANWNFYINELWVITFTTFREKDEIKLAELHNNLEAINSELSVVSDLFQLEDLTLQKNQIEKEIKKELQDEIEQPYQVTLSEKQVYVWLDKAKQARKDSVRSVAYTTWCVLDFGLSTEIIYNPEKFSREWICFKKAE